VTSPCGNATSAAPPSSSSEWLRGARQAVPTNPPDLPASRSHTLPVMKPSVAVLGVGSMGGALLRGLLSAGWSEEAVSAAVRSDGGVARVHRELGLRASTEPAEALRGRSVVVIGVKPRDVSGLLDQIAGSLDPGQVVISLAAGVPLSALEARLEGVAVVRSMPNTPSLIGRGMTAIAAGAHVAPDHLARVRAVLEAVGAVEEVEESQMDAVTAVSGSGPAYVFLLAEALTAAGVEAGLSPELSRSLVAQTLAGSGQLLVESGIDPAELRRGVTSPGGTTAAALEVFEAGGFTELVGRAVAAGARRSGELGSPAG
jgi:pyrroline-5-carboxylate reductase